MSYELHHIIKRNKESSLPETSVLKNILDKLAYPIAFIVPLSSLDQVLSIWHAKSAADVSSILWIILFCNSLFWIVYGSVHKEKAIILGHSLWVILSGTILIQIVLFS